MTPVLLPPARRALPRGARLAGAVAGCALALAACSDGRGTPSSASSVPEPSYSRSPVTRAPDSFPSPTSAASVADTALPFDPGTAPARPGRLVFAHYLPAFTVSIDNRPAASDYYTTDYLAPDGENGKHRAYGGYLRDRPLPRPPRPQADWQLRDLQDEVRVASRSGIDGFVLDIVELPGDPDARVLAVQDQLVRAAAVVPSFHVVLMPDLTGGIKRKTVDELAAYVAHLGESRSAFRLGDGRLVVAPFTAENHSVAWWRQFVSIMSSAYGEKVALVPLFQDERRHERDFAPISYGMSNWGSRSPALNPTAATSPDSPIARVDAVHSLGPLWMQTVSVQDERPSRQVYDEAENTTNLRATWAIARDSGAEWVQIATWNDYAEGTGIAPSEHHGRAFLDLVSYYAAWFKAGRAPAVVRDVVYLTHRLQPAAALPTLEEPALMAIRDGSPARDTVEALVFLTAASDVTVTVGGTTTSCRLPPGVGVCLAPLRPGAVSAAVVRAGSTVTAVRSPFVVSTSPPVQDLQYVAVSSTR